MINLKTTKGFTLIELMIVVAIVAILAAIAFPFYGEFADRARRADGKAALQRFALEQEKFRANCSSYARVTTGTESAFVCTPATNSYTMYYPHGTLPATSSDGHYTINLVGTPSATSFLATATPTGKQTGDECGTFAIDENGPNVSGSYANNDCWDR